MSKITEQQPKVDLHSHTKYSDGKLTPEELVLRAQQMQVDMLAITDHDCVDGILPAQVAINKHKLKLQLISGIEISTKWHGFEIHILGLNVDEQHPALLDIIEMQRKTRVERAEAMVNKLAFLNISNLFERVKAKATGTLSRVHIAQVLVEEGICSDIQQAFNKFLGDKKRAYVSANWLTIEQAVDVIHQAGGIASLAHPYHYDMKAKWLRKLFDAFSLAKGDATEVAHPNVSPTKTALILAIAKEKGLLASIGSDFHGPSRWNELGRKLHLPDGIEPVWETWAK
ncbi:PHP domain-containing protein [Glaciecola sp. 1036]|uniref:PHP domain-containing protein n=1 Tax=Alteromonadaceae TaxID=72275 RepID=UPI003CFD8771